VETGKHIVTINCV